MIARQLQAKGICKSALILLLAMLVNFGGSAAYAQDGTAGVPGAYLYSGVGVRAAGLGKAYTAIANDATAVYWNPAGLATQNPFRLYFMHSSLFMDTSLDFFAATAPTARFGSFGLGVLTLSSRGFDQRSALNEELGEFSALDMAFFVSWSQEALPGLSVGLNYKVVTQKILSSSGTGHGVDLGVKARVLKHWDAGLVLANILSPKMKLASDSETYPTQIRLGLTRKLFNERLSVSGDLAKIIGWGDFKANFGMEYAALKSMTVRVGLENGRFTFGTGLTLNRSGVDYSNSNYSDLGSNHRFAFNHEFGGFGVKARSNPDIFSPAGELNVSKIRLEVKSRKDISQWTLIIVDVNGRVVREFSAQGNVPDEVAWDGRDDRGNLVPDGTFDYRFDVVTADGKKLFAEGDLVTIDTTGPKGVLGSLQE